ncbi:OCIA domain-containing protein 1 [Labeo rohita]|uniref:OCIA domain-containing protein 1 n=1 Tax=Labeo rohita TaxID=84645 RepID=A0ABQ8N3I0_LABRO|nr:OCIA domain-containing protein 1 [Labeo rohita]
MSLQSPPDPERPGNAVMGPVGIDYIPTEEERRVFRECNQESFWYRSLPISAISMALTQFLISRVAGVFGYLGGKLFTRKHPEISDPNKADFEPAFQLDEQRNQSFSYSMTPCPQHLTLTPKLWELRSKNRENYDVMTTQKPETQLKPSTETIPAKRGETRQSTNQHHNHL